MDGIRHRERFAEIEALMDSYFRCHIAPVMSKTRTYLTEKQGEEMMEYSTSPGGILSLMASSMQPLADPYQVLKATGEWNSKTTEDYIEMCKAEIAGSEAMQQDLAYMAERWREAVVQEVGRERYDELSRELGCDLAYAFVDYRVEQLMIGRLVEERMPRSSSEYIIRKAAESSLLGLTQTLSRSPLAEEIERRGEAAYRPSKIEKGAAKVLGVSADAVMLGGAGSWTALARMKNWTMEMLSTLNVDEAVRRAHEVGFDRVQMIQDDKNRWALYLKPENRSGYSIYPDKEDVNRFFSTFKQAMDNIDKVRMELAHKYYALAETQPDLKVDLFGSRTRETDLNRIQRVSVFKTKTDGILCAATIDGTKVQPRSVTPQQWQRMWVAEDRDSYKRHLAATLFADVLRKGQTQEENTGEKQEKEHLQRQGEKATPKRTDDVVQESASPRNGLPIENLPEPLYGRYKEIKDELPEAIVLFKHEGSYYASMYDAETIANELNLPPQKERLAYDPDKMILAFEHDDEETRTQILSLRAFTIDCAAPGLQQETGEQNENEQHPTFRR